MSGRFKSEDMRDMSGITLLLNTLEEVSVEREDTMNYGTKLRDMGVGERTKIASIILTSGAKKENKDLINALKELDLEEHDEFPHIDTINFLKHQVVACFFDAVGAHNQKIEGLKHNTINRALGSHTVLDETRLFSKFRFKLPKKKERKKLKFKEDELIDDYSEYDEYEEEFDDEE